MLEMERDLICCGAIIVGGEGSELYWNPTTGAVCYENTIDGSVMMIGECSISGAQEVTPEGVHKFIEGLAANKFSGAIGLILVDDGSVVAIMSDTQAEIRSIVNMHIHSNKTIEIDLNITYDELGDE